MVECCNVVQWRALGPIHSRYIASLVQQQLHTLHQGRPVLAVFQFQGRTMEWQSVYAVEEVDVGLCFQQTPNNVREFGSHVESTVARVVDQVHIGATLD